MRCGISSRLERSFMITSELFVFVCFCVSVAWSVVVEWVAESASGRVCRVQDGEEGAGVRTAELAGRASLDAGMPVFPSGYTHSKRRTIIIRRTMRVRSEARQGEARREVLENGM